MSKKRDIEELLALLNPENEDELAAAEKALAELFGLAEFEGEAYQKAYKKAHKVVKELGGSKATFKLGQTFFRVLKERSAERLDAVVQDARKLAALERIQRAMARSHPLAGLPFGPADDEGGLPVVKKELDEAQRNDIRRKLEQAVIDGNVGKVKFGKTISVLCAPTANFFIVEVAGLQSPGRGFQQYGDLPLWRWEANDLGAAVEAIGVALSGEGTVVKERHGHPLPGFFGSGEGPGVPDVAQAGSCPPGDHMMEPTGVVKEGGVHWDKKVRSWVPNE